MFFSFFKIFLFCLLTTKVENAFCTFSKSLSVQHSPLQESYLNSSLENFSENKGRLPDVSVCSSLRIKNHSSKIIPEEKISTVDISKIEIFKILEEWVAADNNFVVYTAQDFNYLNEELIPYSPFIKKNTIMTQPSELTNRPTFTVFPDTSNFIERNEIRKSKKSNKKKTIVQGNVILYQDKKGQLIVKCGTRGSSRR
jgi:hypothetical protein